MGQQIANSEYTERDYVEFKERLRQETKILKNMFDRKQFSFSKPKAGFEIEGWITDQNLLPANQCPQLLSEASNSLVVPEISKFNFEINSLPVDLGPSVITDLNTHMKDLWEFCERSASNINLNVLGIGTLPTLNEDDLCFENMTDNPRYYALSQQVLKLRKQQPLQIHISGEKETLRATKYDVMFEAAATSLQIHLQIEPEKDVQYYNNSIVLAAPLLALGANSPFFLGKNLWDETRIAMFEQAVNVPAFENVHGDIVRRVGIGSGYIKNSFLDLFLENLDGYQPLLPTCFDEAPEKLKHLNFHNGTVWRWVRPIVGIMEGQEPHIRIEQRVPSSGPTLVDMLANIAFYIGTARYLADNNINLYENIPFNKVKNNFYAAAKDSMNAVITWVDGKEHTLQEVLLKKLLPWTKEGLLSLGCDKAEVEWIVDEVLRPRAELGRNGSIWQKNFVQKHGKDFHRLLKAYISNQRTNKPVHKWSLKG